MCVQIDTSVCIIVFTSVEPSLPFSSPSFLYWISVLRAFALSELPALPSQQHPSL